nr:S-type pyocin domain-containing protein [Pseudomonas fontis]
MQPGDSSTASPVVHPEIQVYPGAVATPVQPQIETYPALVDLDFDDYIVWFPADSGLKPVYVAFRDRRDDPGVASGSGEVVSGRWLDAAARPAGAVVPVQVADQLRGMRC